MLRTCRELPAAHSIVGKGVLQCSMKRNVGQEEAWQMYRHRERSKLSFLADVEGDVWKTEVTMLRRGSGTNNEKRAPFENRLVTEPMEDVNGHFRSGAV